MPPSTELSPTAAATASGPSRRPAAVVRRWWALKAAATRVQRIGGGQATRCSTMTRAAWDTWLRWAPSMTLIPGQDVEQRGGVGMRAGSRAGESDVEIASSCGPVGGRARGAGERGSSRSASRSCTTNAAFREAAANAPAHRSRCRRRVVDHEGSVHGEEPSEALGELRLSARRRVGRLSRRSHSGSRTLPALIALHEDRRARRRRVRPPAQRRAPLPGGPAQAPRRSAS